MPKCKNCNKEVEKIVSSGYCRNCYNKLRYSNKLKINQGICNNCNEKKEIYARGMCRKCYDKIRNLKGNPPKSKIKKEKPKKEIITRKCKWCKEEFNTNRKNQKFCSPECRKESSWERFQKNMASYSEKISELYKLDEYNEAEDWYSWAKNTRWNGQEKVSKSYEELSFNMMKRIEKNEECIGDPIEEEVYYNFISAIKVFKKLLKRFKNNDKISKLLLREIAGAYFHMGNFYDAVKGYNKTEKYGKLTNQHKYWKELSNKFNKVEQEYYRKKGYTQEVIKNLTPKIIKLKESKEDIFIKLAEKFFNKYPNLKSFIKDRYDKVIQYQTIQCLEDFDDFNGLPLLQIFKEGKDKGIKIEIGSDLTPTIEYSFFMMAENKEDIYKIILRMNMFIKFMKNIFDVFYSLEIYKPSEISLLEDYGNVLGCRNVGDLKEIIKKATKKRWKFVKKDCEIKSITGQISLTPKGYKVELEDKIYIKGPKNEVNIIDFPKIFEE